MTLKEASNQIKKRLEALPKRKTDKEKLVLLAQIKLFVELLEEPLKKRRDETNAKQRIIKKALQQLLRSLDQIFDKHEEVGDTAVREKMYDAILKGFIQPSAGYVVPASFGLFSEQGNRLVQAAIRKFLTHPEVIAASRTLKTPEARLNAFQDFDVETAEGTTAFDYFGYSNKPRTA